MERRPAFGGRPSTGPGAILESAERKTLGRMLAAAGATGARLSGRPAATRHAAPEHYSGAPRRLFARRRPSAASSLLLPVELCGPARNNTRAGPFRRAALTRRAAGQDWPPDTL